MYISATTAIESMTKAKGKEGRWHVSSAVIIDKHFAEGYINLSYTRHIHICLLFIAAFNTGLMKKILITMINNTEKTALFWKSQP